MSRCLPLTVALYHIRVFLNRFLNNRFKIRREMFSCLFVQIFWIYRLPVLYDHMSLPDKRKMGFKNLSGIIQTDRDNRTSRLFRNLKGPSLKGRRLNSSPVFLVPSGKYRWKSRSLHSQSPEESFSCPASDLRGPETGSIHTSSRWREEESSPSPFGNISGEPRASGIGQQNIEITSVISHKQDRLIRNILKSDHRSIYARDFQDTFKTPLHNPQGRKIAHLPVFFPISHSTKRPVWKESDRQPDK